MIEFVGGPLDGQQGTELLSGEWAYQSEDWYVHSQAGVNVSYVRGEDGKFVQEAR